VVATRFGDFTADGVKTNLSCICHRQFVVKSCRVRFGPGTQRVPFREPTTEGSGVTKEAPPQPTRDQPAEKPHHGLRRRLDRMRRTRTGRIAVRVVLTVLGFGVVGLGLTLIPLPGPGWAIVIAGLAILALEYTWAHRLMTFTKKQVVSWVHWVGRQNLLVRGLIGLVGFVFIGAVLWFSLKSTLGFDYVRWGLGVLHLD
jgi:uncharacterized protein (TIGR02611 family)